MAGRNPGRAGPRPGPSGLTKTQQLRQAKSAAFVREYERKQETKRKEPEPSTAKRRVPQRPEPKKVDFRKPGLTKAMLARMKQAEKFKEEYERKKQEELPRRPRRTPAPAATEPRGRERSVGRARVPAAAAAAAAPGPSRVASRRGVAPRTGRRSEPVAAVSERTNELARSMNADVVHAEPVGEGPIESIVIPPGAVDEERTTIVSIPQPTVHDTAVSRVADRSIRVISETLDEQDAVEATAVQNRLADLQQARRDFVMAVANVGGNAVNIGEDAAEPARHRTIFRVPDISDEFLRVEYGRDHPSVVAAREFARRSKAAMREREAEQRMEREFEEAAREPPREPLIRLESPVGDEFLEEEVPPWDDEEDLDLSPPGYEYPPFDPEELERFFDVERYPPPHGPPPGRGHLHPDLWELEDPWYRPPPPPPSDMPDLIQFD